MRTRVVVAVDPRELCRAERAKRPKGVSPEVAAAKREFDASLSDGEERRKRAVAIAVAAAKKTRALSDAEKLRIKMDDEALRDQSSGHWTGAH
jgi:hypothetical protein